MLPFLKFDRTAGLAVEHKHTNLTMQGKLIAEDSAL